MRTFTILFAALALAACGGSDSKTADAKPAGADANMNPDAPGGGPDAPASAPGLGDACSQTVACPAGAPDCYNPGWCSLTCATGLMNKPTNNQFPGPTDQAAADAICAAQFHGSAGTPKCVFVTNFSPAIAQGANPDPNTTYTYDAICGITCGTGNTCPTGLTCQQGACLP